MKSDKGIEAKIEQLLSRNVEQAIDRKHLREALLSGKNLRVKFGIDPTSPDLHLGHAVVLKKLREFQDLGCVAVLVIGDFTAQIGDPSGRDKTRPPITEKEVKENLKNYLAQAKKIIDVKKAEVVYNSKWLGSLKGSALFSLLGMASLQQITEREDFKKRLDAHHSIRLNELLYPIMQAYDSVVIKADVELGGTDQTFNLLAGRDLMEKFSMVPQDVMTAPILEGTDGEKKMSKSLGNYIGLEDEPDNMFGKIMSLPDALNGRYFMLCTDKSEEEIKKLQRDLGPKALKEQLGFEIVVLYHGAKAAETARESFAKLFSRKEIPDDIPELKIQKNEISVLDMVLASGSFQSKSEARRLIEQGGFDVDNLPKRDPLEMLKIQGGEVIKIGKRRFFRLKI